MASIVGYSRYDELPLDGGVNQTPVADGKKNDEALDPGVVGGHTTQ